MTEWTSSIYNGDDATRVEFELVSAFGPDQLTFEIDCYIHVFQGLYTNAYMAKKKRAMKKLGKNNTISLVEQIRAERPNDLYERNLKYVKYANKRSLDTVKAKKIVQQHIQKQKDKNIVRLERQKINCLREQKSVLKKSKSVFSDKDFNQVKKEAKKLSNIKNSSV
uniref:40S ribosomal protein S6 n=1 Tax=Heterorhabditis bacteriophora TaxID=37862 RepID=A0A1I7XVH8_HETBA